MNENLNNDATWYRFAPMWDEIVGKVHPTETAPVHIVKPETGKVARVADPFASTLPRHTRRHMVAV